MKCPQREVGVHDEEGKFYYESAECLKEKCEWWDEVLELCAPIALNTALLAMGNVLSMIQTELCLSRYTFRCRDCGLTITRSASEGVALPADWIRTEQVDGKYIMLCAVCSNLEK